MKVVVSGLVTPERIICVLIHRRQLVDSDVFVVCCLPPPFALRLWPFPYKSLSSE